MLLEGRCKISIVLPGNNSPSDCSRRLILRERFFRRSVVRWFILRHWGLSSSNRSPRCYRQKNRWINNDEDLNVLSRVSYSDLYLLSYRTNAITCATHVNDHRYLGKYNVKDTVKRIVNTDIIPRKNIFKHFLDLKSGCRKYFLKLKLLWQYNHLPKTLGWFRF